MKNALCLWRLVSLVSVVSTSRESGKVEGDWKDLEIVNSRGSLLIRTDGVSSVEAELDRPLTKQCFLSEYV